MTIVSDNFDDGVLASIWSTLHVGSGSSSGQEVDGVYRISIASDANGEYTGIYLVDKYDKPFTVKVKVRLPNANGMGAIRLLSGAEDINSYPHDNYYHLRFYKDETQPFYGVKADKKISGTTTNLGSVSLSSDTVEVWLKIEVTDTEIIFYYSLDGSTWNEITRETIDSGISFPVWVALVAHGASYNQGTITEFDDFMLATGLVSFRLTQYPSEVKATPSASFTVNIVVANEGSESGTVDVRIRDHNNSIVASKQATVAAGSSTTVSLSAVAPNSPGTYTWKVEAYNVDVGTIDDSKSFTLEVTSVLLGGINIQQITQLLLRLLPYIILLLVISAVVAAIR